MTAAMGDHGPRLANDACQPLITLARAWLDGWRPPAEVSEDLYRELKAKQDPADPLTAFVGFGVSFGGKWFGGHARTTPAQNYLDCALRALEKKLSRCAGVSFTCLDFGDLEILPGDLVYADPPYRGTTAYGYHKSPFDHDRFVRVAQGWAAIPGVKVFVSEYAAQADTWDHAASFNPRKALAGTSAADLQLERLFRVRPITPPPV
jgi:DNA adenine methylase